MEKRRYVKNRWLKNNLELMKDMMEIVYFKQDE